jgi:hypothetical protein
VGRQSQEESFRFRDLDANAHKVDGEPACKPGSVESNHSSTTCVTAGLEQPTRKYAGLTLQQVLRPLRLPYLALLRVGFAVPSSVATDAVRSYRTLSPLPAPTGFTRGTLRRFAFCCTFRGLAPPRRYLAPCPPEPGLSSPVRSCERPAAIARPAPRAHHNRTAAAPRTKGFCP